jgi:glycine/D-amino acid oxidase-like deaminating enzyme
VPRIPLDDAGWLANNQRKPLTKTDSTLQQDSGTKEDLGRPFAFEEEPMAEESYFTYNMYPILTEYFPCFNNLRPNNSWAGFYDINSVDSTPIVDKISNCIIATGMSRRGIMKADAVRRIATAAYQGTTPLEQREDRLRSVRTFVPPLEIAVHSERTLRT